MTCTLNKYSVGDNVWVIVNNGYFRAQIMEVVEPDEDSTEDTLAYLVTGVKDAPTKYGVIGDALVSSDDISNNEIVIVRKLDDKNSDTVKKYERTLEASKKLAVAQARRFVSYMQSKAPSWSTTTDVEDAIVDAISSGFLNISYRKIQETGLFW